MKDPEFIKLRNTWLLAIFVALIFIIPFTLVIFKYFAPVKSNVYDAIKKRETFLMLVIDDNYKDTKYTNILDSYKLEYKLFNIESDEKSSLVIERSGFSKNSLKVPSIIYYENGEVSSYLLNIKDENELYNYLSFNEIVK